MKASARRKADDFNKAHPVGTPIRYWIGRKKGEGKLSVTTSPARILGGHTAVVWVKDYSGCVALSHLEVVE